MQTLYTVYSTTEAGEREASKKFGTGILNEKLNRALDLFTISILYTFRVAQYAETDARVRGSKYLPTTEDLNVNTKIAANEFMWQVLSNQTFTEKTKDAKIDSLVEEEWVKKLYQQLEKTDEYLTYIEQNSRVPASEKAIMQFIWEKLILENEALQEHFTEELQGWEDDKEMIIVLMQNFFKSSSKINFLSLISAEKREYAQDLMQTVIDKEAYCNELIEPKLKNWDSDRVALIDLLLLRMGICELLYFPTIPTKVTINEYIEVAKLYSTPQSGQFVNGVLDNILKNLEQENKINKQERTRKS